MDVYILLMNSETTKSGLPEKLEKMLLDTWNGFYLACAGVNNFHSVTNACIRNFTKNANFKIPIDDWYDYWFDNFPGETCKITGYWLTYAAISEPFEVVCAKLLTIVKKYFYGRS